MIINPSNGLERMLNYLEVEIKDAYVREDYAYMQRTIEFYQYNIREFYN